jgi:hypothetical protein
MARHQIVRRELRFDVRLGYDPADAHVHSLENSREVEIKVHHRHIEAVVSVFLQELVAEEPPRNHEPVIEAVNARDAKAPVDVFGLELIRHAFDVENELVLFESIRS